LSLSRALPWNPLWNPPGRQPGDPRPRYRIVYQLLPDERRSDLIEVISIGQKPHGYWAAADRHEGE
jgi:hypothetical protein